MKTFRLFLFLTLCLFLTSCQNREEQLLITESEDSLSVSDPEKLPETDQPEEIRTEALPASDSLLPEDSYLTKDFDPRCSPYVCESEKRLYFAAKPTNFESYYENFRKYVFYIDKESGESGYLCGKPGCSHDSEDCGAYLGDKQLLTFCLYEGKLYAALKEVHDGRGEIVLIAGRTGGSGFSEIGIIPSDAYALDSPGADPMVCIHRGYLYTVISENTYADTENEASGYPVITEEKGLAKRFSLENLNLSEELYRETLSEAWQSAILMIAFDGDDPVLYWEFENDDEERSLCCSEGALIIYRFPEGGAREELFRGENPVSLNGRLRILNGEVRISGRNYQNDRAQLLQLDPEEKRFLEIQNFGSFTELDNYYGSYINYGDGYYYMVQDLVVGLPRENRLQDGKIFVSFYGENGALLSERILNITETMEALHLYPAGFGPYMDFYMNRFACDRDSFYGMLNITGDGNMRYQAVLRIPIDGQEPWQVLAEKPVK